MVLSEGGRTLAAAAPFKMEDLMTEIREKLSRVEKAGPGGVEFGDNMSLKLVDFEQIDKNEEAKRAVGDLVTEVSKKLIELIQQVRGDNLSIKNIEYLAINSGEPISSEWMDEYEMSKKQTEWSVIAGFGDVKVEYCMANYLELERHTFNTPDEALLPENNLHSVSNDTLLFLRNTAPVTYRFVGGKNAWHGFVIDFQKKT